jgi:hypothetical protein
MQPLERGIIGGRTESERDELEVIAFIVERMHEFVEFGVLDATTKIQLKLE